MNISHQQLRVTVHTTANDVAAEILDPRADTLSLFGDLDEDQRQQLVADAWTVGLRALGSAYTSAREAKLEDIGVRLLADIDRQLHVHVERQHATIGAVLDKFFDPRDGQVSQRLAAFVDDQGVLARLLEKYVGPDKGVLAETLARQIGESSPLFQKLSATDSAGLVKILEGHLKAIMDASHVELVRALDPLAKDGAVSRFLASLREELKGADHDRQKQLSAALAALDANDEGSLLSRLVRETHHARQEVLTAINPDAPGSPLAVMKASLTGLLREQTATQVDLARRQEERQTQFEKEVREAIARIETKRTQDRRGIRGGLDFEDAVASFIRATAEGAPCTFSVTGATAGVGRCKKGDAVLRFTDESAFGGSAVVFEAKQDASYTVERALAELDAARKNRDADVGVFIMARSHACPTFPPFARHGSNVLVTWDEQDPSSDPVLHAAIMLGMMLVSRTRPAADAGDIEALRDIEARIEAELVRLDAMDKHSEAIRRGVDGIDDQIRKGRRALDLLLRRAESTLRALNAETHDEAAERETPITMPSCQMPMSPDEISSHPHRAGTLFGGDHAG